jgi:hypothetical protein
LTKHHDTKINIFIELNNEKIQKMKFSNFMLYFSSSRINRYLVATGNSKNRTVKLYKANLKVSQAFHPLLGILEVVLRNRINDIMTAHFNDSDWIINQKTGFMSDPSLKYIQKRKKKLIVNKFLKEEIEKAEKRIKKTGRAITSGKIIAEQTFGFWTDLFEIHHYKLLKGKPIQIFQTLPTGYGRKEVNNELDAIRRFRNRINHNEPICFVGDNIDFKKTINIYHSIISILSWINPELLTLTTNLDAVQQAIEKAKKV